MESKTIAIVGAGIAGLSLAWHLVQQGHRVQVFESSTRAAGASVRNFGMVWPVGQPNSEIEALALRSREHWKLAASQAGFWNRASGSLHLAYEDLEWDVLREYIEASPNAERRLVSPTEALKICPAIREVGLKGGLFSSTEHAVDPREVVHLLAEWLQTAGVEFRFGASVATFSPGHISLHSGEVVSVDSVVLCAGPSAFDLISDNLSKAGIELCHLQMLRLTPKPGSPSLGIHLCAGLTQTHYKNFKNCPSLPAVNELHREKWPEQVRQGIHVLVAEHGDGTITLGDSHSYGRQHPVYGEDSIDELILSAMDEFLPRDNYAIRQRWIGTYPTHPTLPYWKEQIEDRVWALNLFGTGMTLSFGVTELLANEIIMSI